MARLLTLGIGLLCMACLLASCQPRRAASADGLQDTVLFRHATLLRIVHYPGYTVAEVKNPWHPQRLLHRYLLVDRNDSLPHDMPPGTVLRTPLRRMTVAISAHCALLRELHAADAIGGVCDAQYMVAPWVHQAVAQGSIQDMGSSLNSDVEKLLASGCDAILLSPYDQCNYGAVEKTRIPILECADYMENSPLARAEWMRFYGRLVGRAALADSIFLAIEEKYNAIKALAQAQPDRPTLFADLMTGSTWYQPGGRSTMGRLYADAGAHYLWDDNPQSGSVPLNYESVLHRAADADIWVIKYGAPQDFTYASLIREQTGYAHFRAHRQRHVWGCNLFRTPFYEDGAFHPERILSDLVRIVHPTVLPDGALHFYTPLNE